MSIHKTLHECAQLAAAPKALMTDAAHAAQVRTCAAALNSALRAASGNGMHITVEVIETTSTEGPFTSAVAPTIVGTLRPRTQD